MTNEERVQEPKLNWGGMGPVTFLWTLLLVMAGYDIIFRRYPDTILLIEVMMLVFIGVLIFAVRFRNKRTMKNDK